MASQDTPLASPLSRMYMCPRTLTAMYTETNCPPCRQIAHRLGVAGAPKPPCPRGSHCVDGHRAARHAARSPESPGPSSLGGIPAGEGDGDIRAAWSREDEPWVTASAPHVGTQH
jgi:hypothetical protein